MPELNELMKNVSLKNMHKVGEEEVKDDELLVVLFKDDVDDFHINRNVKIVKSLMQLDATLCYTIRDVDKVLRMKLVETYTR